MTFDAPEDTVTAEDTLREIYPAVSKLAEQKALPRLEKHCRNFIAHSPFLCLSTADAAGKADVSPRGDAPGFVQVLDDKTLLIPDRRGNNRLDSMSNIIANPNVGLIFLVPGVGETLRINGKARIVRDEAMLASMAVNGKAPTSAILVEVDEAFLHCAKAIIRSKLWDEDHKLERGSFPSLGRMISEQIETGQPVEVAEAAIEDAYKNKLY